MHSLDSSSLPKLATDKSGDIDLEANHLSAAHLKNDLVTNFAWNNLTVKVRSKETKQPLNILNNTCGLVNAGEMLAIMGPSGSGKTTLLNSLAHRQAAAGSTTTGHILGNGQRLNADKIRQLSAYVEQEDVLIGSLTCRETIFFAASLALSSSVSRREKYHRVDDLLSKFGLQAQSNTIVGTPIRKGLSGGQKKRLSVASRLVTDPKILFLDEPTSGLDSTLSYEVMKYIKQIAQQNNLIVIASIHQPSTSAFGLFDKLCLLSNGDMSYFGTLLEAPAYFASIGQQMVEAVNPAEFYLDLINTDLARPGDGIIDRARSITQAWISGPNATELLKTIDEATGADISRLRSESASVWSTFLVQLHRSWIKSYRDVVVYGIRVVMYLGLAILMGTVFLRLGSDQVYIQPYINALFFGGAFMSFMAVAYVPAFLEDRATFAKERANGLIGPASFIISNFAIGLPFLFIIAVLFSVVTFFLIGFDPTVTKFFKYIAWLFLDLVAAESLVVLASSIFPVFVVSLAVTAFANGLWMCVDGFLVPLGILNVFWRYVFHYIDYQAYVFQGMMVNNFEGTLFDCVAAAGDGYSCQFPGPLNSEGKIGGDSVLTAFNIDTGLEAEWFGIMIAIIVVYRVLGYVALLWLKVMSERSRQDVE